ncbi:FadR/GntR family transcriptional regulator [Paenibacillus humicola]|uniref:FadR/GntR family transcriptional regulator n=1 Tax=Paenibacillus humicola TaxID=3110540 RepID=UPI00237AC700|nr:FadR/GntR family transcriptional regulator [Paenibacillus humicola]
MFQSIKKPGKLYVKIAEQINQLILKGTFKPGEKLPSEKEIAEKLQVSRPSVREALAVLEILGILEVKVGDGSYVKTHAKDLELKLEEMKDVSTVELMEARQLIESLIVDLAVQRATTEQIASLQESVDRMRECLDDNFEEYFRQGSRFHSELAAAANNEVMFKIAEQLLQPEIHPLAINLNKKVLHSRETRIHQIEEHQEIIDAIRERDLEKARKLMIHHIKHLEELFLL